MEDELNKGVGIRISSEPEVSSGRKIVDLPLRFLLVSEFLPQAPKSKETNNLDILQLDKNNLSSILQQLSPRLEIDVANFISDAPRELELSLQISEMNDFRPEGLARQVPGIATFVQIRELLTKVKDKELEPAEFKKKLAATGVDAEWADNLYQALMAPPKKTKPKPSPKISKKSDEKLGSLLDMVDVGDTEPGDDETAVPEETSTPSRPIDALIQAIDGEKKPAVEKSAAEMLIAEMDQIISQQINAVLHHPQFQRLEAAWRGAKFLVDRLDFRKNIILEILNAEKENLREIISEKIVQGEYGRSPASPLAAVILDFELQNNHQDLLLLEDLATALSGIQCCLITGVSDSFLSSKEEGAIGKLPVLWQHLQRPEFITYNAFREKEVAKYVVLAATPFLLRFPYGKNNRVKGFEFQEVLPAALWGNGALAITAASAGDFVRSGWLARFTGTTRGKIENLPFAPVGNVQLTLKEALPEGKLEELYEAGFATLGCFPNDDSAYVFAAPTLFKPQIYEDPLANAESRLHSTLGCQLVVSRIARHLLLYQAELGRNLAVGNVQTELTERLLGLLKVGGHQTTMESVQVDVIDHPNKPGAKALAVRVRPPASILGQEISLVMGLDLA